MSTQSRTDPPPQQQQRPSPRRPNTTCTSCRRSKVKCINQDGQAPCQRCRASGYTCAFEQWQGGQPGAYDWRTRTESVLAKLSEAVECIARQQQRQHRQNRQRDGDSISLTPPPERRKRARVSLGSSRDPIRRTRSPAETSVDEYGSGDDDPTATVADAARPRRGAANARSYTNMTDTVQAPSRPAEKESRGGPASYSPRRAGQASHSPRGADQSHHATMTPGPPPSSRPRPAAQQGLGPARAGDDDDYGDLGGNRDDGPTTHWHSSCDADRVDALTGLGTTDPTRPVQAVAPDLGRQGSDARVGPAWESRLQPTMPGTDPCLDQWNPALLYDGAAASPRPELPHAGDAQDPAATMQLERGGTEKPSVPVAPILVWQPPDALPSARQSRERKKGSCSVPGRQSLYRYPSPRLGMDDPRLNAIRLGLVSIHEARHLFAVYAKGVQPFNFGFPEFPASSHMTPVLISAVASVASLFSPTAQLRSRFLALRDDVFERTSAHFPIDSDDPFNVETGIGTEEIVGAAIVASYDASHQGWQLARAARWWSARCSYDRPDADNLTVGEMVAILPPLRNISRLDRERVRLSAFVVEVFQCVMHGQELIGPFRSDAEGDTTFLLHPQCDEAPYTASVRPEITKADVRLAYHAQVADVMLRKKRALSPADVRNLSDDLLRHHLLCQRRLGRDEDAATRSCAALLFHLARVYICSQVRDLPAPDGTPEEELDHECEIEALAELCNISTAAALSLLCDPRGGLLGNLAKLPAVYHFLISHSLGHYLQELQDRRDSEGGSVGAQVGPSAQPCAQSDDLLRSMRWFVHQYAAELQQSQTQSASTAIVGPRGSSLADEPISRGGDARSADHDLGRAADQVQPPSELLGSDTGARQPRHVEHPAMIRHPAAEIASALVEAMEAALAVL
ncbi:uncharacterized protein PFL1_06615 [Pseudozyma flocculosa PF-1]|uniref:Zn(2)-C6 fungal-type domain-containing protein n=1 Tax=Pseudozyma flocculosa PF-1 TaxID=1277687 RepID=A0A061H0R4_9BASI|nr:uncharacterized protein PFL1_06615 [Pseudozyma flocculosa PF-1]EPQ25748.1 hypothetical protein PFL1_06615 [Pseudozyma flocculosa PF-1]